MRHRTGGAAVVAAWCVLTLGVSHPAAAGDPRDWEWGDIQDGMQSSFDLPVERLFVMKSPSEWRNALDGLSVGLGFGYPLSRDQTTGPQSGSGRSATGSPTLQASFRYVPLGSWFVGATAYRYLSQDRQAPWNPDFSYYFGYDDGRPFTFSLVYANYGGNRFRPDRADNENVSAFNKGTWTLGWKFPVPRAMATPILFDSDLSIDCRTNLNVTPRYYDDHTAGDRGWKKSLSLACRYPVVRGLFVDLQAYWYPRKGEQQPWDPDFVYAFGYSAGWPGNVGIQYANYSGNRYPGRRPGESQGRFIDGEVTVTWSYTW